MNSYRVQHVENPDPPRLPAHFVAFLVLAAGYAVWRTTVVDWSLWYGPVAWLAEMFGLTTTVLFLISIRRSVRPRPRAVASPTRTVDILVPTVNEPLAVLEATVIGALNVRGVRDVLVLDDGARPEARAMAERLGARYLPRSGGAGAKAGNLNNGLQYTDAEFLVTLDADHIPLPHLIQSTLGYFDDPSVGFVQSPQTFYNTESFTFRRRGDDEIGWHEQEMFYDGVQPAKAATNSAIYTGTSAMLRRSAIDSVGGFATGLATEDIHTSLRLHANGWRSVYFPEPLAYGLEVENLEEYYRTRRRWAAGSLALLFRHPDSPLRIRGLSADQRISYTSAMVAHLQGLQRLVYLLIPLAALVTGRPPVHGSYGWYGFAFLSFVVLSLLTVVRFGRGHYHLLHSEVFGVADSIPMISSLRALVGRQQKFTVTKKRAARVAGGRVKAAYRAYAGLSLVGLALAVARLVQGEYVVIATWAAAFLLLASGYAIAFLVSVERYERRPSVPAYTRLSPAALYRYVVALSSGVPASRALAVADPSGLTSDPAGLTGDPSGLTTGRSR